MPTRVTRLFEQFQPKNYDLLLDINKEALTFKGTVMVNGRKVGRPSKRITFHQKGLRIIAASIVHHDKKGNNCLSVSRINPHKSLDEIRIHSDRLIYPGEYTITIEFAGQISQQMHGIYPCYFKQDNKEKALIATQFESHHAREAFPCIDEPEAKAVFMLKTITPSGEQVIANTPILTQEKKSNYYLTTFEPSPIMSTYLLAFAVGEIHNVTDTTKDGTIVSTWATVAQNKDHLKYANSEAVKCLEFFSDYFKTPFPLKKLDQIALPDFDSLAMENWGLITYREVGLLADPKNRSLSGEQLISLVIAHEVSHQWFGNLVTMKWWDDLWLNESFASIMENIALVNLHPDWQQWEEFATSRVLSCSHRDIYKDVQPVGVKVKHPDEIMSLFDPAIVYAKGARLLTMLYEYVSEPVFRAGLQNYFKTHAYKNTTRDDLWKSLGSASKQNIEKLMTPWIEQSGQPLLSVKRQQGHLKLSQKRFLMDGEDKQSLWPIPLLTDQELSLKLLDKREASVTFTDNSAPMFNKSGNGHYIVAYDNNDDLDNLVNNVKDRSISSISRITLINDMFLLSRSGIHRLVRLIELVIDCSEEPRDAVWSMFLRVIGQAQSLTDGDKDIEKQIKSYKRLLAEYWYQKLGWEDKAKDDPNTKHLRTTALALSIAGENKDAVNKALTMYKRAGSVESLPAEQRALIAGVAVRLGDPSYINNLMKEYETSPNPDVQQAIAVALCSTKDSRVASQIIKWGLSDKGVIRQQDIANWYAYLMRNHCTRDQAWEWFIDSWDRLTNLFGGGKHMEYFVWYSAGPLSTPTWQSKFKKFFESKMNEPGAKRNILISFSEIEARVEWRKREEKLLKDYFKQFES